jgi:xanthine dehydrogenase molybdenum-binding subunit
MDEGVYRNKVGFRNDGKITAVQADHIYMRRGGRGWSHLQENTVFQYCGKNKLAWTIRGPAWSCRCEQQPNSHTITMIMNQVADAAGLDPTEVALKHDGHEGEDSTHLMEYKHENGLPERDSLAECIQAGKAAIDWDNKWHAPNTKILANGNMHGIAMNWTHEWGGCIRILIRLALLYHFE